jgi:hypothetical protein
LCFWWMLIFFSGLSSSLSYSDRVETLANTCWCDCALRRRQQRCRWMDPACIMRCTRQCWKRAQCALGAF